MWIFLWCCVDVRHGEHEQWTDKSHVSASPRPAFRIFFSFSRVPPEPVQHANVSLRAGAMCSQHTKLSRLIQQHMAKLLSHKRQKKCGQGSIVMRVKAHVCPSRIYQQVEAEEKQIATATSGKRLNRCRVIACAVNCSTDWICLQIQF